MEDKKVLAIEALIEQLNGKNISALIKYCQLACNYRDRFVMKSNYS